MFPLLVFNVRLLSSLTFDILQEAVDYPGNILLCLVLAVDTPNFPHFPINNGVTRKDCIPIPEGSIVRLFQLVIGCPKAKLATEGWNHGRALERSLGGSTGG
jgi:hypothetical protein